jgi:hypothetical protein
LASLKSDALLPLTVTLVAGDVVVPTTVTVPLLALFVNWSPYSPGNSRSGRCLA